MNQRGEEKRPGAEKKDFKGKVVQVKESEDTIQLSYVVEVTDKNGKVIQRIAAPSRSFVRQWYDLMAIHASHGAAFVMDTGGVSRSVGDHENNWRAYAIAGVTTYGIRVGKGTTPVTIDDYALYNPIEEGMDADQLSHQAMTYVAPAVADSTCSFVLRRSMINNSGNTISGIKEIGCYMRMYTSYYAMGFRDVLPSSLSVPDGGTISVAYTLSVTA